MIECPYLSSTVLSSSCSGWLHSLSFLFNVHLLAVGVLETVTHMKGTKSEQA